MLKEETIEMMFTKQFGEENDHGLCWEIVETPNKVFIGHSGGDPGINTAMYFHPGEKRGLIILTNCSHGNLLEMMDHFLNQPKAE